MIDEVQRAPALFLPIKYAVDQHRRSGQFMLSGSAIVLLMPRIADSLAGRMEILTLWPLAQAEIEGAKHNLIDALFAPKLGWAGSLRGLKPDLEPRNGS